MNGQYRIGDTVMKNWVIKKKLGEGSFGKVYRIEREEFGEVYHAALKIITVPQSDAEIQAALEEVTQGRTCLMIAHRLSTVRNADMILVVRDGKIVEQGTHPELLAKKGYYHSLYTRQYEDETTAKLLG